MVTILASYPVGLVSMAALAGIGALVVVGGFILYRKGRPRMQVVTIIRPADGTIAVAGKPVVFTAETSPPHLAARVTWSVTTRPDVHDVGPVFSHTFDATGVEQVVARVTGANAADDVIVYVFKTPSGGSTAVDLLHADPPPAPPRSADSFTRYRRAATIGRAS